MSEEVEEYELSQEEANLGYSAMDPDMPLLTTKRAVEEYVLQRIAIERERIRAQILGILEGFEEVQ